MLDKYEFKESPKKLTYLEGEPLKLSKEQFIFHNKSYFRKKLVNLQYLFKENVGVALHSPGIRDSYLKGEYTANNLVVILTDNEHIRNADEIVEKYMDQTIEEGCYTIATDKDYLLLMAGDMEGLEAGLPTIETMLKQTFDEYFEKKDFDTFIQIPKLELYHCASL